MLCICSKISFRRLSGAIALSVPTGSSPSSVDFQPKFFASSDDAVRVSQSWHYKYARKLCCSAALIEGGSFYESIRPFAAMSLKKR